MTDSDPWSWLEGMPSPWSAPDSARKPTASILTNIVIAMLSSEMLGNDLIEIAGELQAEHARFNRWMGALAKSSLSLEETFRLNAAANDAVRRVYEAWISYSTLFEEGQRKVWVAVPERQVLEIVLIEAKASLASLQIAG
ncbi:hypothetical protein [Streptomyces sp. NPDC002666]